MLMESAWATAVTVDAGSARALAAMFEGVFIHRHLGLQHINGCWVNAAVIRKPLMLLAMRPVLCSYTSSAGMAGVFTTRPAMELLWGYEDSLLQLLDTLLPPGSLQDGPRVGCTCGV
jgi:hypothetical protein